MMTNTTCRQSSIVNWLRNATIALPAMAFTLLVSAGAAAAVNCLDTEAALDYWRPIHEQAKDSDEVVDDLALELISCLASPNPELRDRIGYDLFTFWLRNEKLSDDIRRSLLGQLSATMTAEPADMPDSSALARSFSALILAEVMRSDSNAPFMTAEERQTLLTNGTAAIAGETDYRGLDADLGWIHPIAHMSDLLWRFALHAETTEEQAKSILDAIRSKVAPTTSFYGFNESDRLARVVTTVITRNLLGADKVSAWLSKFEAPTSMAKWSDAFASPQGMTELHNTKLFVRALADQLDGADIDPALAARLNALVQEFTQLI